jgi:hypothetical protein
MTSTNNTTIAAVAAAKAQAPASASGRPAAYALTARITVQTDGNPKKPGTASYDRFALYYTAETVADYIAAVVASGATRAKARADLRWDQERGFITIG